jgi:hypothetical protein
LLRILRNLQDPPVSNILSIPVYSPLGSRILSPSATLGLVLPCTTSLHCLSSDLAWTKFCFLRCHCINWSVLNASVTGSPVVTITVTALMVEASSSPPVFLALRPRWRSRTRCGQRLCRFPCSECLLRRSLPQITYTALSSSGKSGRHLPKSPRFILFVFPITFCYYP